MAYQVTNSSLWIATMGCLFDHHIPDFIKKFIKEYPELLDKKEKDPGNIKHKTPLGELVKILGFNVKGKYAEVKKSLKAFEKVESPYEIINSTTEEGKFILDRYKKLNKEYEYLISKAKKEVDLDDSLLVFIYPSDRISFTRELSNELTYLYPDKTVMVGREKNEVYKISLRNQNKDIAEALKKALAGLEGFGGGHKNACGCSISKKDFNIFIERMRLSTQ